VPIVMLGEHSVNAAIDHVAIDNVEAARTAVAHLVSLGHRRIAAIGANPHRGTADLRMQGYRTALAEAGLVAHEELVAPAAKYHRYDGAQAMKALLDLPEPPDAVFCFNDLLAVGALRAAADRGLSVPRDLAVVGFDDIEEGAYANPTLTTISPDKKAIAETAVSLISTRITFGASHPARSVVTPHALRVRASTVSRETSTGL
jgi:DNA-binding LacI/PurR family transcriptional regulator